MNSVAPAGFRLLLIEDDMDLARLISGALNDMGFQIYHAPTGQLGLQAWERMQPHLILLDLMLPGMSGEEICRRIRGTSTVPIVVLTAKSGEEAEIACLRLGADDYIPKPFAWKVFLARVVSLLRRAYRYDESLALPVLPADTPEADAEAERIPAGWAVCEACGYAAPQVQFEKISIFDQASLKCPRCGQSEQVAFAVA